MKKNAIIGAAALAAGSLGAAVSLGLSDQLLELDVTENLNLWFEADAPRAFANLTDRTSDHYRTAVHPIASLLLSTPTLALTKLGLSAETAARLVLALGAGGLASAFFLLIRRLSGRLIDAAVFTALLICSSAFIFFSPVFELYAWAGLTVVLALLAATVVGRFRRAALVAGLIGSMSITITNAMTGFAAALTRRGLRGAIQAGLIAFGCLAVLAAIQSNLYPTSGRFLSILEERNYTDFSIAQRVVDVPRVALVGSVVLDRLAPATDHVGNPFVTSQSGPTTFGWAGVPAALGWVLLLVGGGVAAWRRIHADDAIIRATARIVLLVVAGQLLLHLVYGSETFLYSLHFAPLLIFCASFLSLTRWRVQALVLAGVTASLTAVHNVDQFGKAHALADRLMFAAERSPHLPRQATLDAMAERPGDLWPRGGGHVAIGLPGAPAEQKGWIEPGGSFSPGERSFGIAIWIPGDPPQSSDTIPIDVIRQRFLPGAEIGVEVETPWYVAQWQALDAGVWLLKLASGEAPTEIVLRSAGPAGGPIRKIERFGEGLVLNDRWLVEGEMGLELVDVGAEMASGWITRRDMPAVMTFEDGWGAARFRAESVARLRITDQSVEPAFSSLETMPAGSGVDIEGGDARLTAALDAQIRQILMGAVGEEARPGDPINYPLAWQRDAAFIVVALVRAGRLDAARVLSIDLAQRDFFGGFGAEGDAPGLALWALGLVSRGLDDRAFDALVYDDVHRKAELVLDLMHATQPVREAYQGPVAPMAFGNGDLDLVADIPSEGLINGRMDWHRPRMFVTAVSVRGLEEAVRFAERTGDRDSIGRWSQAAGSLRASYEKAMQAGVEADNPRTLMFPLRLTPDTAGGAAFAKALDSEWEQTRDASGAFRERPLWPYFDLAIARQNLRLGEMERAWSTVEYFWNASPAPGLYTLWESDKEENTSGRWQKSRGWVRPAHVTPHYWASAEMALTLVDMLAFVEGDMLTIGAGAREAWLDQPMAVRGIITEAGAVAWTWDGARLTVEVCDPAIAVKAAGPFEGKPVTIRRC